MFKLAVLIGGAKYCMVLSSLARLGVIRRGFVWLSIVRSCPVRFCEARHGLFWRGRVLRGRVSHGDVLYCRVRHGLIDVLRGMALYSTVLSCPVWLSKAVCGKAFRGVVSCGGAGSCPAESSPVWLCKVRRYHGIVRSACVGRGTVERGFVLHGKVLSWSGEVLIGAVGFIGALYSLVRSYCGVVWSVEALHGVVKFGPVKHCVASLGVIWSGDALRSGALSGLVKHGKVLFWQGGAGQREVRHAKLSLRRGTEGFGFARLRAVGQATAFFGKALLGYVRRCPVLQGRVRLGRLGYGGVTKN